MKAARAFFRSAKAVTGITPDRVTTDGHDSYPSALIITSTFPPLAADYSFRRTVTALGILETA
jgi:hypothetical protein